MVDTVDSNNVEQQAAIAFSNQGDAVVLSQPTVANEKLTLKAEAVQQITTNFDPNAVSLFVENGSLFFFFENDSQIEIEDFATVEPTPSIVLQDGNVISGDVIVAQFSDSEFAENAQSLQDIETAAGEAGPTNDGTSAYSDEFGNIIDLLDFSGPINFGEFTRTIPTFEIEEDEFIDPEPTAGDDAFILNDVASGVGGRTVTGPLPVDGNGQTIVIEPADISTFTVGGSLLNGTLTSDGNPITVTVQGDRFVGELPNGDVAFELIINNDSTYQFNIFEPLDHADSNNPGDIINFTFDYIVTDETGDTAGGTISVAVVDDAPIVSQASNQIDETDGLARTVSGQVDVDLGADGAGSFNAVDAFQQSGSIANGVLSSNGQPVSVTFDASTNTFTGVAGGATVFTFSLNTTTGAYDFSLLAPLDHADGTDANDSLILSFPYQATDNDGDTASGQVDITVLDDGPLAVNDTGALNENGFVTGTVVLNDSFGEDGAGQVISVTFAGQVVNVGTTPVVVTGQFGTLTLNSDGSYSYQAINDADLNGVFTDSFTYQIEDFDGDVSSATLDLSVSFRDGTPDVLPEVLTVDETGGFDRVTGQLDADFGDDVAGSSFEGNGQSNVGGLTSNGSAIVVGFSNGIYTGTANGVDVFTLQINANGSYAFEQLAAIDHPDTSDANDAVVLTFGFTANDGDNDSTDSTITVTVLDDGPDVSADLVIFDETDGLSNQVSGQVDIDFGLDGAGSAVLGNGSGAPLLANLPALTSGGATVTVALNNGSYVGTIAGGAEVFRLDLSQDGSYTYTQNLPLDHLDATDHNDSLVLDFGLTVTDNDGDSVTSSITINVLDDGPVAVNDGASIFQGNVVTGNVVANDDFGLDGAGQVISVAFAGQVIAVGATPVVVTGQFGTLTLNSNGSYSYQGLASNPADGNFTDSFTYVIQDNDGDTANAQLNLTTTFDTDDVPVVQPETFIIDETGGFDRVTGQLDVTFGDDVAGSFFEGNGQSNVGSLTSNGAPIVVGFSNGIYTGTANGVDVFTLQINANGSYAFEQLAAIDHPNAADPNDAVTLQFGFTANDGDNDSTDSTITVTVLDDGPSINVSNSVIDETAGLSNSVSGNVAFDFGLDGAGEIVLGNGSGTPLLANLPALTSGGAAVTVALNNGSYVGTIAGGAEVFRLDLSSSGSYTYTQNLPLDHPDATDHNDLLVLDFGLTVIDNDGDSVVGSISIDVRDDGPVAAKDNGSLSQNGVFTGNVTTNDDYGTDGPGQVISVSFGGQTITIGSTDVALTGQFGTLTISPDGSYSYRAFASNSTDGTFVDRFDYVIEDNDGDTASAHLHLSTTFDRDDVPVVKSSGAIVDETGGFDTVQGTVSADFGADAAGSFFRGNGQSDSGGLTSAGVPIVIGFSNGVYTGAANGVTVFTLSVSNNGSYVFQQLAQIDHPDATDPDDDVTLQFGFDAVDGDGDSRSANINIVVHDDGPQAGRESFYLEEDDLGLNFTGDLFRDFGADEVGAFVFAGDSRGDVSFDFAGAPSGLTVNGDIVSVSLNNGTYTGTANGSQVFTLEIDANGGYDFVLNQAFDYNDPNQDGEAIHLFFGYGVEDGDGDIDVGQLQISITESPDSSTPPNVIMGTPGNDILIGTDGDDIIHGNGCFDIMTGGAGADTFVIADTGSHNRDIISDYDSSEGDIIDLSELIDPASFNGDLSDYLLFDDNNVLHVDTSGNGQFSSSTQAVLLGDVNAGDSISVKVGDDVIDLNVDTI